MKKVADNLTLDFTLQDKMCSIFAGNFISFNSAVGNAKMKIFQTLFKSFNRTNVTFETLDELYLKTKQLCECKIVVDNDGVFVSIVLSYFMYYVRS